MFLKIPLQLMAVSRRQVEELQRAHEKKMEQQKLLDDKRKLAENLQAKVCHTSLHALPLHNASLFNQALPQLITFTVTSHL